jgi:hypothetical protein
MNVSGSLKRKENILSCKGGWYQLADGFIVIPETLTPPLLIMLIGTLIWGSWPISSC